MKNYVSSQKNYLRIGQILFESNSGKSIFSKIVSKIISTCRSPWKIFFLLFNHFGDFLVVGNALICKNTPYLMNVGHLFSLQGVL